ncbi:uncharacterized protein [Musca autumnalis]|uniref:uncharacterized protein n=1 Tax=Musca autumnalis TaxID=221902 RepID=UPI003CF54C24
MLICGNLHRFFVKNYLKIGFGCIFSLLLFRFLHLELTKNKRDLIYWKILIETSIGRLDQFGFILIALILIFKVLTISFVIVQNSQTMKFYKRLSQLEVKKRYADFLLLRLLAEIEGIEMDYLRSKSNKDLLDMKSLIEAHNEMNQSVLKFRKDARKLLWPNESEITQSIEDVYGLMAEEEESLKKSKFYYMNIHATDALIRKLINP